MFIYYCATGRQGPVHAAQHHMNEALRTAQKQKRMRTDAPEDKNFTPGIRFQQCHSKGA